MPRPTENDPDLCQGSHDTAGYTRQYGWLVCGSCGRVLKQVGAHRVRSRTTASMDRLRDGLLAGQIPPLGSTMSSGPVSCQDYQPGDVISPMDADPRCRVCGEPKRKHPGWRR